MATDYAFVGFGGGGQRGGEVTRIFRAIEDIDTEYCEYAKYYTTYIILIHLISTSLIILYQPISILNNVGQTINTYQKLDQTR